MSPVQLFLEGGPAMYVVVALALLAPLPLLLLAIAPVLELRVPAFLWLVPAATLPVVGALGTWLGGGQAVDAIAHASLEMQGTLAAAGLAVAQYPWVAGLVGATLPLLVGATLVAIAHPIGAGDEAEWTPLHAVAPVLLGLIGGVLGVALPLLLSDSSLLLVAVGPIVAWTGVALGVASLRLGEDDADRARLAAARLLVGTMGLLAAGAILLAVPALGEIRTFDAIAHASAEMRSTLMAAGHAAGRIGTAWPAVGALVLAVIAAVAPVASHLLDVRGAVGALLALLVIGTVPASLALQDSKIGLLRDVATGSDEVYAAAARIDLPVSGDASDPRSFTPAWPPPWNTCLVERAGTGWAAHPTDGRTLHECPEGPLSLPVSSLRPTLAVDRTTPARVLAETRWFPDSGTLQVLATRPEPGSEMPAFLERTRVGTRSLVWLGAVDAEVDKTWSEQWAPVLDGALVLEDGGDEGTFVVHSDRGAPERTPLGPGEILGGASAVLVPGDGWTVEEMLRLCGALSGGYGSGRQCYLLSRDAWRTVRPPDRGDERAIAEGIGVIGALRAEGEDLRDLLEPSPEQSVLGRDADAEVLGSLDRAEIRRVLARHAHQLRYCYQREVADEPGLQGSMTVKFIISRDGSVDTADVAESDLDHPDLAACVTGRFLRMQFPRPEGGGIVIVVWPLEFRGE